MTRDNRITKMATKVSTILILLFSHSDIALVCWANMGGSGVEGLSMVRDRRSRDFFCRRNSTSLFTEFVRDVIGVDGEVGFGLIEANFKGVVWGDDIACT